MSDHFIISSITVDSNFVSIFSEESHPQTIRGEMVLTDRIEAQNLRLRKSTPGYSADWHVAGDATLIIIQKGVLRLSLRNGEYKDFKAGDSFIAKDYLPEGITFDTNLHGHKSEVIGNEELMATHIKLG